MAGARNVVIFNAKCISEARKVTSANGRVRDDDFMLGSFSDRSRIVNDTSSFFRQFFFDFRMQFCVAGAVFDEVGG